MRAKLFASVEWLKLQGENNPVYSNVMEKDICRCLYQLAYLPQLVYMFMHTILVKKINSDKKVTKSKMNI